MYNKKIKKYEKTRFGKEYRRNNEKKSHNIIGICSK